MVQNLGMEETIMSVKPKQLGALQERLKNRTTTPLCTLYSAGYDPSEPGASTPGMTCLENLRNKQRVLTTVKDRGGQALFPGMIQ